MKTALAIVLLVLSTIPAAYAEQPVLSRITPISGEDLVNDRGLARQKLRPGDQLLIVPARTDDGWATVGLTPPPNPDDPALARIAPGDMISVTVFELFVPGADASLTLKVDHDGWIKIAGIIAHVGGLTTEQARQRIMHVLDQTLIRDPLVTVTLQDSATPFFSVLVKNDSAPHGRSFKLPDEGVDVRTAVSRLVQDLKEVKQVVIVHAERRAKAPH